MEKQEEQKPLNTPSNHKSSHRRTERLLRLADHFSQRDLRVNDLVTSFIHIAINGQQQQRPLITNRTEQTK